MSKINLLPWRDEYRQEKKQEFLTILGGVGLLVACCTYVWISTVQASIDNQLQRNSVLELEIGKLQTRVKEIQELKKRRSELLERMKVIQGLQGERPVIVRYFDELVRSVPEGVYLTNLSRSGNLIELSGITESNVRVSALMRNISGSDWFSVPNLKSVKAAPKYGEQASEFKLTMETTKPVGTEEEG